MSQEEFSRANAKELELIPFENPEELFETTFRLFIAPELRSRAVSGSIELPYPFEVAQVVFYPDGAVEVRLNDEVSGRLHIEDPEQRSPGDRVKASEIQAFKAFERDAKDKTHAHITLIYRKLNGEDRWTLFADPRVNLPQARLSFESGEEFLTVARFALDHRSCRPAVENLFLAMELFVKAELLTLPMKSHSSKSATRHGYWLSAHRELLSPDPSRKSAIRSYQWLIQNHVKARYKDFSVSNDFLREIFDSVELVANSARARIQNSEYLSAELIAS